MKKKTTINTYLSYKAVKRTVVLIKKWDTIKCLITLNYFSWTFQIIFNESVILQILLHNYVRKLLVTVLNCKLPSNLF